MQAAAVPPSAQELAYDLYLRTDGSRFYWRLLNRGVRLFGDRIGWTADGRRREPRLADITEIHLTRGGGFPNSADSPWLLMWRVVQRRSVYMSICRISFRGGDQLYVTDSDARGFADPARAAPYSEFVVRLHERLAARPHARTSFVAGYSLLRYRLLLFATALLAVMVVGALTIFVAGLGNGRFFLAVGAAIGLWFQFRMIRDNAPRRYDPAAVPDEMLPAMAGTVERLLPPPRERAPEAAADGAGKAVAAAAAVLSRRWPWLVPVPALLAVGGIVWLAGVDETARMFEPGQAQQALATLEQQAGRLRIRKLEITPGALTVTAEVTQPHADRQGLASYAEGWAVTRTTRFAGWREWDRVSGPAKLDSTPVLEEAATKAFTLAPSDLPDLPEMARAAIEHATIANAVVRGMRLVYHDPINPRAGEDPLRWTVSVASPRESAEIVFDHTGHYAGADLAGTQHAQSLDLFAGGKDLDEMLHKIRDTVGGEPIVAFMRIAPHQITLRTEDKQYEADTSGVIDKTPQLFLCHMTTDITAGRFRLGAVDWSRLADLVTRAREAVPMAGARVDAVVLAVPQADMPGAPSRPQWSVEAHQGGMIVRVVFDDAGTLLGVRPWSDRHYCD